MRVLFNDVPAPRLLSTAAAEGRATAIDDSGATLQRGRFWGNGFAIFVGVALAGLLICGVSTILITRHAAVEQVAPARLVAIVPAPAATPQPTATPNSPAPAAPQVEPDLPADALHLTSIALGHPRLAVINRQEVAEGDWVYLPGTSGQVRRRLRVVRIADGKVELTIGRSTYLVPLQQMKLKPAR